MSWIKNCVCDVPRGDVPRGEKNHQSFQLNIPQLELLDRGVNVLTGHSGSGKTTFALALCGLQSMSFKFQWWFKGENLALLSPSARRISLLFQTLELFPHLSSKQNILFPIEAQLKKSWFQWIKKSSPVLLNYSSKFQDRFNLLKEYLFLDSFLHQPVGLLSGGERQRVALARALMITPRFLILDEPFSYLDFNLRQSVVLLLKKIIEQDDLPVLLITHSVEQVKPLVGQVFIMNNGTISKKN